MTQGDSFLAISVDRRGTVADMRKTIFQVTSILRPNYHQENSTCTEDSPTWQIPCRVCTAELAERRQYSCNVEPLGCVGNMNVLVTDNTVRHGIVQSYMGSHVAHVR